MRNETVVNRILRMNMAELLAYVIENPEDLISSYYKEFGAAIRERHKQLVKALKDGYPV